MTEAEAVAQIVAAVAKVAPAKAKLVTPTTDLISEGVLDSLDVMSFMFQLEKGLGRKLTAIDESFTEFTVPKLAGIIRTA